MIWVSLLNQRRLNSGLLEQQCCPLFQVWKEQKKQSEKRGLYKYIAVFILYGVFHGTKLKEQGRPGYSSIWLCLHLIILWLSAPNRGDEFCFLKAGYSIPSGLCNAGVVPGVNVCLQGCVFLHLAVPVCMSMCVCVCDYPYTPFS